MKVKYLFWISDDSKEVVEKLFIEIKSRREYTKIEQELEYVSKYKFAPIENNEFAQVIGNKNHGLFQLFLGVSRAYGIVQIYRPSSRKISNPVR